MFAGPEDGEALSKAIVQQDLVRFQSEPIKEDQTKVPQACYHGSSYIRVGLGCGKRGALRLTKDGSYLEAGGRVPMLPSVSKHHRGEVV